MAFGQQADPSQRYELVSTLGRGGFAEVFLGWVNSVGGLRRKVAIKRILPELVQKQSKMFEEMFVDEARLAFQLEHENIVRVYDVGQSANTYFIVMEYVEGMDLKHIYNTLTEQNEPLPMSIGLYIGTRVASGLAYAHSMTDDEGNMLGLVHNDISPPNILIGRNGEVKVADFGLSDARSNSVETPEGMVKGKFAYISPEGTRDPSLVSYKSDIFSIGIVLWELIAGRRLFQRNTDIETFKAVRDCDVTDLREVRPDCPPGVADVIHKALSANPDDRHRNCEELATELLNTSYRYNIPIDGYQLRDLVRKLQGGNWTGFSGERVSGDEMNDILNELGGILPPGVADDLGEFVTGGTVAEFDEDASAFALGDAESAAGWMEDAFAGAGFDTDDGLASFSDPQSFEGMDAVEVRSSDVSLDPVSSPSTSPVPTPPPPTKAASTSRSNIPVNINTTDPNSSLIRISATQLSSVSNKGPTLPSPPSAANEDQPDIKNLKVTFLVWGALAGLLIGVIFGALIGSLI